ncbi:MAG: DUF4091 domain-containing protein [Lentisphaeria bacterium]|nr:DUF4091 domain-containing protein [Lentisphaeria bacterium]
MLEVRLISALEKVLPETQALKAPEINSDVAARGEVYSFQIALRSTERTIMRIESASKLNTRVRVVKNVPVMYAGSGWDNDVLRNNLPGLYPDLLAEPDFADQFRLIKGVWQCLWVTVYVGKDQQPGKYPVEIVLRDMGTNEVAACPKLTLDVLDFELLPQEITNFHWFHVDCLFDYYKVPCWSEEHWQIVENFARNAFDHGINMLYTPLWTPPLDTAVGHSRPACQLLDITFDLETLTYSFNFDRLRRYIEMGQRIGFKKFGMSHIFTQWGAKACPKIQATVINTAKSKVKERYGELCDWKKFVSDQFGTIFGWGMPSTSLEYADFLKQLFPALLPVLREYGFDKESCYFSLSDEPHAEHIETYAQLVELTRPLLEEFETVEALSKLDFYKQGLVQNPVPSIAHIEEFKETVTSPLWAYYCCGPESNYPNRFIGMPSRRPRSIGMLAYIYDLAGFLHWGYNFYYSQYSWRSIDPFATTDAEGAFPAGDAFLVYPGKYGDPLDAIRNEVIFAGWQDLRACRTLEKKIGREAVIALLNEGAARPLKMNDFPADDAFLLGRRRAVYEAIAAN